MIRNPEHVGQKHLSILKGNTFMQEENPNTFALKAVLPVKREWNIEQWKLFLSTTLTKDANLQHSASTGVTAHTSHSGSLQLISSQIINIGGILFDSFFFLLQQGFKGFQIAPDRHNSIVKFNFEGCDFELSHGSVVIAAITSCTNTSNPSVMLGAGKYICSVLCAGVFLWLWLCVVKTKTTLTLFSSFGILELRVVLKE